VVAVVDDTYPGISAGQLLATVTWGDGSSSAGTVTAVGGGAFTVTGANTFVAAGSYPVTVAIRDTVHDLQVTVQGTAIVQDAAGVPAPQPVPLTPHLTRFPGSTRSRAGIPSTVPTVAGMPITVVLPTTGTTPPGEPGPGLARCSVLQH
jgi:hypothetical protein